MSGGSYDYAYRHILDLSDSIREYLEQPQDGMTSEVRDLRLRFADLLVKIGEAAKRIEWVDSCDFSPGDEIEILKLLVGHTPGRESLEPVPVVPDVWAGSLPLTRDDMHCSYDETETVDPDSTDYIGPEER